MTNLETLQKEARDGFNTFLKESCGHYAPHLLDSDNNDGEVFRDGLEKLLTQAFHAGEAEGRTDLLKSVTKYQEQYVVTSEMIRQGIETLEILDKRMKQNAYRAIGEAIGEDNKGSFGSPLTPDGYAKRFTVYVLDPKAARQGDKEGGKRNSIQNSQRIFKQRYLAIQMHYS